MLLELLDDVAHKRGSATALSTKLQTGLMILRLDSGYLARDILNTLCKLGLQIIIPCRYCLCVGLIKATINPPLPLPRGDSVDEHALCLVFINASTQ